MKQPQEKSPNLVGLDAINWAKLAHAYGSAEDVPGLLRDLASRDKKKGEKALYAFYGNIYHQGTTYEATGYAVPFLRQILADEANPHRAEILELLVHLAFGSSYHEVHQWLSFNEEKRQTDEFQAQIAHEKSDVQRAHDAVADGVTQYLALWTDKSPKTRANAVYLASLFGRQNRQVAPALKARLENETDSVVRATLWMGFAFGAVESQEQVEFEIAFECCENELEKWALAALLLRYGSESTREAAAQIMLDSLEAPEELEEQFGELPFQDSGIAADSIAQLLSLGTEARKFGRPLCDKLRGAKNQYQAESLLDSLCPLFFGDFSAKNPVTWQILDAGQREVVQVLADTEGVWGDGKTIFANLTSTLRYFGLPTDRVAMQNLVPDP